MVTADAGRFVARDGTRPASRSRTVSPASAVLVLSGTGDTTTEAVAAELRRRGSPVICFDTASFPLESKLTAWSEGSGWRASISSSGIDLPLDDLRSVWFRRPSPFRFHPDMSPAERRFADHEAQMAWGGLLRSLDCLWVNHPDRAAAAQYKPLQLKSAAELGFKVPRSLITSDAEAALSFFDQCEGRVIYKPMSGIDLPTPEQAGPLSSYTTIVKRDHLRLAGAISATPCLFQEYVSKKTELRLVIIGSEIFPVQIFSQHVPESTVDRRRGYGRLRYRVYQLPRDVRERCLRLSDRLGLASATVDLVITPEDEYVFLGINPSGKWLWLETMTGLPMIRAMADLLSGEAPARRNDR